MSPEASPELIKSLRFGNDYLILRTEHHLIITPMSEWNGGEKRFLQHSDIPKQETSGEIVLDGGFVRNEGKSLLVHGAVLMEGNVEVNQGKRARHKTIKQLETIVKDTEIKDVNGSITTRET
jgi:hypothetical protein